MKNAVATILFALIVLVGSYWYIGSDENSQDSSPSVSENGNAIGSQLVVAPQHVVQSVEVYSVVLEKPGFVSVREVIDGKMGQILEVSDYLEPGEYTNLVIDLFDVPTDGVEPVVVVHEDNGDEGFNPAWDEVVLEGDQVVARYTSTGELVETSVLAPQEAGVKSVVVTVKYTDDGFEPQEVVIKQGETVLFVNESSNKMWVASNPHPSHVILSTFDQFGLSDTGETYQYTFEKKGEWRYHDHINASFEGTVIVE